MSERHPPQIEIIPLFPLGLVLLPGMELPLHIFEERYKRMVADCLETNRPFGIVLMEGEGIRTVGCRAHIVALTRKYEDGRMDILTRGGLRFTIRELIEDRPYMEARVAPWEDTDSPGAEDVRDILKAARDLLAQLSEEKSDPGYRGLLRDPQTRDPSFGIAALEDFTPAERQRFLEMTSGTERLEKSVAALDRIVRRTRLTNEISRIIGGNGRPPSHLLAGLREE